MSRRKLTDAKITEARKMREDGMFYYEIGDALGVGRTAIYYALDSKARSLRRLSKAEYRKNHKKERAAYDKRRHKDNRENILIKQAEWRNTHKEQHHRVVAKYQKDHLPERAARQAARKALILGATLGNLAEIEWIYKRVKEAPKVRCYLCGKLTPIGHRHVDHIVPLSKGGAHRPSNLAIACDVCNASKGSKMPEELGVLL